MAERLVHLHSGWAVDQAIQMEPRRIVVLRFGKDGDRECMKMDDVLADVGPLLQNMAIIYLVDIDEVSDFNDMYELYDPCAVMFFHRNRRMMVDLGTGNNNKINWAMEDKQEFMDLVELVYRGAMKGKGLVVSPRNYATKLRF
jgi:DIM1 family U5 snRNP protein